MKAKIILTLMFLSIFYLLFSQNKEYHIKQINKTEINLIKQISHTAGYISFPMEIINIDYVIYNTDNILINSDFDGFCIYDSLIKDSMTLFMQVILNFCFDSKKSFFTIDSIVSSKISSSQEHSFDDKYVDNSYIARILYDFLDKSIFYYYPWNSNAKSNNVLFNFVFNIFPK